MFDCSVFCGVTQAFSIVIVIVLWFVDPCLIQSGPTISTCSVIQIEALYVFFLVTFRACYGFADSLFQFFYGSTSSAL
jgi:hypothetical protein